MVFTMFVALTTRSLFAKKYAKTTTAVKIDRNFEALALKVSHINGSSLFCIALYFVCALLEVHIVDLW